MISTQPSRSLPSCFAAAVLLLVLVPGVSATVPLEVDVFTQLLQHVRRQALSDKREFSTASQCMTLFYHRERRKPDPPAMERIAMRGAGPRGGTLVQTQHECDRQYPGGLEAVRQDFQRTQTSLSVTLTFYEFALVGDGDDNGVYSQHELNDVLQALNLPAESAQGAWGHVRALTGSFDAMHTSRSLESLMSGMSKLYDQGYRFTAADKANLDRVME